MISEVVLGGARYLYEYAESLQALVPAYDGLFLTDFRLAVPFWGLST